MIKILKDLIEERRKNKELEEKKKKRVQTNEFLIEQGIICKDCGVIIGYSFVAEEKYCVTCQRDKNIDDILN
jgi:hypothetical protein